MSITYTIQDFDQFGALIPLPQKGIYENDFTTDPVGDFDFTNSDYIGSGLTTEIITDSPYVTGTITANGLESASYSAFSFNPLDVEPIEISGTFLILETDSEIIFSLRSNQDLTLFMGFKVVSSSTGVNVQSLTPDDTLFDDQILAAPDTNWLNKSFTFYANLTSDRIWIRIGLNDSDIYNRTIELTNTTGTLFFCSINDKIAIQTLLQYGSIEIS